MDNAICILDIHTHRQEAAPSRAAIVNRPLLADEAPREGVCYSAGIHPWELTESNAPEQLAVLRHLLEQRRLVAVGEAGLDRLAVAPMDLQRAVFKAQVELSEAYGLPLVIHCVKAQDELLAVRKECRPTQPWVWHGFRGKPEQAAQLLGQGLYLSFGGRYHDAAMREVPDNRLLLETDDDTSLDVEDLLRRAAAVRGVGEETLRATIRSNVRNVFFRPQEL